LKPKATDFEARTLGEHSGHRSLWVTLSAL